MHPFVLIMEPLLAQRRIEPIKFAVEAPEPTNSLGIGFMLIYAALVLAVAAGVYFLVRLIPGRAGNDGQQLFGELCRANHLSRRQRRLLLQMARSSQAGCPSQMFLDIGLWKPLTADLSEKADVKQQAELLRLRSLLFTFETSTDVVGVNVRA